MWNSYTFHSAGASLASLAHMYGSNGHATGEAQVSDHAKKQFVSWDGDRGSPDIFQAALPVAGTSQRLAGQKPVSFLILCMHPLPHLCALHGALCYRRIDEDGITGRLKTSFHQARISCSCMMKARLGLNCESYFLIQ